jgi:hypothetical protein
MISPLHAITDAQWCKLTAAEIARLAGTNLSNVHHFRRTHRKPKGPRSPGSGRPPRYDLSLIDWSLSYAENARRVGCTPSYIAQLHKTKIKAEDFA